MKAGLLTVYSKFLSKQSWYESIRCLPEEDELRSYLLEIAFNHIIHTKASLKMKLILRLMLTYEELHETLYSNLEDAAVEAANAYCKIEEVSSTCNQSFYGLEPTIQKMKADYHRDSLKKYKTIFKTTNRKQRNLDNGAKCAYKRVVNYK